ncbi:MAG: glycosyltransferase [Caldilineaceae bacterium]
MSNLHLAPVALSIIIPNTNSCLIDEIVGRLIEQGEQLGCCEPFTFEVLVVGQGQPRCATTDVRVHFIATPPYFAGAKRNLGISRAQAALLLFLDDDCLPLPGLLAAHWRCHRQGQQVVGGAVTFGTDNYWQLADNVSAFHDLLPTTAAGYRPYLAAANLSVQRAAVVKAGLMRDTMKRAEDLEWTVRLRKIGYRLYFVSDACVYHDPDRLTFAKVWQHWTDDAPETLRVRLCYADQLATPKLARYRTLFLWGAPVIALWATWRTLCHRPTLWRYWYTAPLVYLTKIAWCWGAFRANTCTSGATIPCTREVGLWRK